MKISKILIAIDDSKYAEYAASYGFDLAKSFNAHVGLVHIVEPTVMPVSTVDSMTGLPFAGTGLEEMEVINIQNELSDNIVDRTIKKYAGELQVTHFNEFGATADGIISCSKEFGADLIVMGTHSRTGIDRLLMGNVAETVIRTSHIPVLVVPLAEENRDWHPNFDSREPK
ncbi:universal stress protein [Mucilaginibacter terrenus]|uniref:Universal stress protein n=1 Tax=Mucilaginibacter terrenus TaxID=2482727 RepID=A0A3E2NLJ3_9SPHI|nr:universal stress protein [Mucilaginibacter terrenus]RFZ81842.1 universal stress protein [Mucilaginibacter terrenus]